MSRENTEQSDSKYLNFERIQIDGRSTPIVRVISKSNGMALGRIAWFSRWRQFCFYPANQTIFNIGCMNDISCVIQGLHDERRKVRK